jgi:glutamate carboxypeptidase
MTAAPSRSLRTSASRDDAEPSELLAWLRARSEEAAGLVARLAEAESPSLVPESTRAVYALLATELERVGFVVRPLRAERMGDHLYARPERRRRGAPFQLLVGHMDTVWPLGTLATMPVRREGDLLYGPGVADMKGGLAVMILALRALTAHGLEPAVTPVVLVTSDEELGSVESLPWLHRLARGAVRAFVLEAPLGLAGRLKTSRKGTGWFRVVVRGRAAHAGVDPAQGRSAILELSHQIQRLFELNDPRSGVTVNVGTIDGGLRPNVVAPEASAMVDVRVPTAAAGERLEAAIRALRPVTPDVSIEVEGRLSRPPLERTPRNRALWRAAKAAAAQLGLPLEETGVGGASDGNYTSLHTATLDGLGAVGVDAHAVDERIVVSSLPERAALLALLLLAPLETVR